MTWLKAQLTSRSSRRVDLLLAVGLAAMVTLASLASDEPGSNSSTAAAYALGAAMGGLALVRRRWPVGCSRPRRQR